MKPIRPLLHSLLACTLAAGLAARPSSANAQRPGAPAKAPAAAEQPVGDKAIQDAVERGISYIWSKQHPTESHWEAMTQDQWAAWAQANPNGPTTALSDGGLHGGNTSLVLLGLLKSGVNPDDKRFEKALRWLAEQPIPQTYSRAMHAVLLASLNRGTSGFHQAMENDKKWLLDAMYADGTYGYCMPASTAIRLAPASGSFGTQGWRDLSNTQYGILGVWQLSDAGLEVPAKYWQFVQGGLLKLQNPDGGWAYGVAAGPYKKDSHQSMTLAGLASLFVVWDKLYAERCDQRPDPQLVKAIKDGLDWMGKSFNPAIGAGGPYPNQFVAYTYYSIERVGVASGLKYFGEKNWWDITARAALARQLPDGSWPPDYGSFAAGPVPTAYALLFLAYGRAPVVFNKLAYGDANQWNSRPRDLARLTVWMNRANEKLYNWQIMPIERPVEELLDAPILLMSGRSAIKLTDEQKAKLKDYVLGGGLLLGESADSGKAFNDSFRALVRELFPELEMQVLPATHPIYSVQFQLSQPKVGSALPALEGLSNGVRTMIVLSPKDLSCAWQQFDLVGKKAYFELGGNLMQYVSDRQSGLIGRGASYMVKDLGHKPAGQVTVGRLVWGSKYQWDPEPAAWKRMDIELRNNNVMGVSVRECDFAAAVDPGAVPVVHLTGVGPVLLTEAQKANLRKYVESGGLLLADAAGGNKGFVEGFTKLANELFGPLVPAALPFAAEATDGGRVLLRHYNSLPKSARPLEALGCQRQGQQGQQGQWGVIFLPYDLTAAMAGYPNLDPVGLTVPSADKFVTGLLKWAVARTPTSGPSPAH